MTDQFKAADPEALRIIIVAEGRERYDRVANATGEDLLSGRKAAMWDNWFRWLREHGPTLLSALEERAPKPAPEFRTITLTSEVTINGVRYDPGTYQIGRVGEAKDEPTF